MHAPIVELRTGEYRETTVVDAYGRNRKLATGKCPRCTGGLFIIVQNLLGMHMTHAESLYLIEALRQGQAFQLLKPSPLGTGRSFLTQNVSGGRWLLAYGVDGVCDFVCSGNPSLTGIGDHAVAFTAEQRGQFADVLLTELMEHATAVARA